MSDGVTFQSVAAATPPASTEIATDDCGADGHVQVIKLAVSADGSAVLIPGDASDGLRVNAATVSALLGALSSPAAGSVNAQLAAILVELGQKLEAGQTVALDAGTLAALESITVTVANPVTGGATEATLASVLSSVDGLEGKDYATQVTLAAVLAKLSADPATQTTLAAILAAVDGLEGFTDGIEGGLITLNAKDFATQVTLAAVLAKLSADPATQTTLAALLADSQAKADLSETQPVSAASLPLPSGASTSAKQDSLIALVPASLGQKTKVNSFAVVFASDQDALAVTDNGGSLTVDGTVAATQSGTWTVQPGNTANTTAWKVDGSAVTQPVSGTVTVNALPSGTNNIGDVDVLTMPTVTTKHAGSTGAQTIVASTTTPNTTLIAADSARFGLTIYNDSTAILYVLLGAGTESTTVHTVQIAAGGYYEVPDAFVTMRASGHWVSANGSARITAAS